MQRLFLISCALAIVLVCLVAACGSEPVSRSPLTPAAPSVGSIQISGPTSIAPGQSAQFIADLHLSDGTDKSSTAVRWRSSNTSVLQVSSSGLATTGQTRGEAIVTAEVLPNGVLRSSREVLVLPDGTYRVVGSVREAEAPVPIMGARVEVSGTSLSTTTDFNGQYRLYGVPPAAEIKVTANGFVTLTQSVQLTAHATQNFQLALSGPRISLNGLFTLSIDAAGCSGSPALSADLQHRRYDAQVTTTGSSVDVLLTESSRFKVTSGAGNRFSGRAGGAGVTFTLQGFYGGFYYYYYYNPNIVERLSNGTYLVVSGTAATSRTGEGVSGLMNGSLINYDSRFPAFNAAVLGRCGSSGIQLTLTPR